MDSDDGRRHDRLSDRPARSPSPSPPRRTGTGRRREPITTAAAGIDHWLEHRGLLTVLGARVVPGMPFTTINYAAGFSKLRFWQFTAATALGVIPSTYLLATVGSAAHQPTSERFIIAAAAIAGASAAVAISGQTHRRRRNRTSPHAHGAPGRRR